MGQHRHDGRRGGAVTQAAEVPAPVAPAGAGRDPQMWADFLALCDFGGRVAGSPQETAAATWAQARLAAIADTTPHVDTVDFPGWRWQTARLTEMASGRALVCTPLLGTASTPGTVAEVLDLGFGRPDDFARCADQVRGRIAMVRHEYPFATAHVHRRAKLAQAQRMGAVGFLIAHPEPGVGPVSGSSGRDGGPGIPALGIGVEAAAALCRSPDGTLPKAAMIIAGEDYLAAARMLVLDLPGRGPEWIVVSAHIDGHPHGESAIDNATGVAVAIALARRLAPHLAACPRGLRICLTTAEEWGLAGSRIWLDRMPAAERGRMRIDINLDSVGGAFGLTALTSGFGRLDTWVASAAREAGLTLATHLPPMPNSDHANFAGHGIPALRLIAGFNSPTSHLRLLLTGHDRRHLVLPDQLEAALDMAGALAWRALTEDDDILRGLAYRP